MKKRIGPSTVPWGTPPRTMARKEYTPLTPGIPQRPGRPMRVFGSALWRGGMHMSRMLSTVTPAPEPFSGNT